MLGVKVICNICHDFLLVYSSESSMYFLCLPGQKVLPVVSDQHEAIGHVMFRYSALVLGFLVCCFFSPHKHHSCF